MHRDWNRPVGEMDNDNGDCVGDGRDSYAETPPSSPTRQRLPLDLKVWRRLGAIRSRNIYIDKRLHISWLSISRLSTGHNLAPRSPGPFPPFPIPSLPPPLHLAPRFSRSSALPLQRPLLLGKLDNLPLDKHTLPLPNVINVDLRNIGSIRLLSQVLQLFHRSGHPERVQIERLVAGENELGGGCTRGSLSDFCKSACGALQSASRRSTSNKFGLEKARKGGWEKGYRGGRAGG